MPLTDNTPHSTASEAVNGGGGGGGDKDRDIKNKDSENDIKNKMRERQITRDIMSLE